MRTGEQMTSQPELKALRAMLTEELKFDPSHSPIALKMDGGSIVMEGMVASVALKKRALLLAMGMQGVAGVVDRLRVRPSVHMSDDEIRDHMTDALTQESSLSGLGISVEVRDGVVDLEGRVSSLSHKRLAGVLAWWVPGSLDVINSIEVNPPEADTDDELIDAIRIALEKDALVDAHSVHVSASGYVVTLEGITGSASERESAEDDAWFTWGVNNVINKMTVDEAKALNNR
jgi:osmotically-inducible protein OsmY